MPETAEAPIQKAPPLWDLGAVEKETTPNPEVPPVEPVKETPVEPEVQEEKEPEDRSMVEKVEKPSSKKGEQNWAKVREDLKTKDAEIQKYQAQLKEANDKAAAEVEQREKRIVELQEKLSKANPDDFTAKEQKYQQELEALRNEFKLVALEKDPEFIRQYDAPKQHLQGTLQELAVQQGINAEDFQRMVKFGQDDKLDEIREGLPQSLQRKWDAAFLQIEQLNQQKEIALKDKETTYQQITQKRQQQYQHQQSEYLRNQLTIAEQLVEEPFEKIEALRGDEQLKADLRRHLRALAGESGSDLYSNTADIMRAVGASVVQTKIIQSQHAALESSNSRIQELETKLKEMDEFIQQKYGSLPNTEVKGTERKEAQKAGPLWNRAQEAVHGRSNEFI